MTGSDPAPGAPPAATEAVDYLRAHQITLTYDPKTQSLRTDTSQEVKITLGPARRPTVMT